MSQQGSKLESVAAELRDAYTGDPIAPLRSALAADDVEGAYAVQDINTQYWVKNGRQIVGRKIGLTSAAVQKQLGVSQPDFGTLFADMELPNGGSIARGQLLQPKAEAEVALVLDRDITDADCSAEMVKQSTAYAVAAIEIVDSRIADWKITFADTVADNGSAAMFVLGDEKRSLNGLDLFSCGMVLEQNGVVVSVGAGGACLGHPLNAAAWLAQTMITRGQPLRAGDILLTGALGPMVGVEPGDRLEAHIGGLGTCSFSHEGV